MAEKKSDAKRDDSGKRMTPDEARAQDEATGDLEDGRLLLTNDSGEVKRVNAEEWGNEEFQADLLKKGWRPVGDEEERLAP